MKKQAVTPHKLCEHPYFPHQSTERLHLISGANHFLFNTPVVIFSFTQTDVH